MLMALSCCMTHKTTNIFYTTKTNSIKDLHLLLHLKYLDDEDSDEENINAPINIDENNLKFIKWR